MSILDATSGALTSLSQSGDLNSILNPQQSTTSTFNWNNLIASATSVVTSIFGKQPSTTITTPTGTTSSTGTGQVVIGAGGTSVMPEISSITTSKWFWPVIIILLVLVLFGRPIIKLLRRIFR